MEEIGKEVNNMLTQRDLTEFITITKKVTDLIDDPKLKEAFIEYSRYIALMIKWAHKDTGW